MAKNNNTPPAFILSETAFNLFAGLITDNRPEVALVAPIDAHEAVIFVNEKD